MASMMFKEKKKLARNEASRALKKYAKMVRKEGLVSDRVKIENSQQTTLEGKVGEKEVVSVQRLKNSNEEQFRDRHDNNFATISSMSEKRVFDKKDDSKKGNSRELKGKEKQRVKRNPFARQQREAEEKATLRAQQQEEKKKVQAMIKEKERIREAKKRKFLRQKKPNVGGQIGRLLEKIQQGL